MEVVKNLYLKLYLLVFGIYIYLNKGVAYTYLVEILWIIGFLILVFERKSFYIPINRKIKFIFFFLAISIVFIIRGMLQYSFIDLVRDSFIFQYSLFVFIIFLFANKIESIWEFLFIIYKWLPLAALINFILQYFVPAFESIAPFGGIPILLYKNGDMGVQILVSTLLFMLYPEKFSRKWKLFFAILVILDFLIFSAYSRSGMVSFLAGIFCFVVLNKDAQMKSRTIQFIKYVPWFLLIVVPIYINIQVEENFQGRAVGLNQILNNFSSVLGGTTDATSENNVIWRLLWWAKILNYSFSFPNFFIGKGLGINLAISDNIATLDNTLRSPHNFHLNIMARFGVLIFIIWIFWLIILFKPLFKKQLTGRKLALGCILLAFIINASFDVFLEGPMGAFPFWTFIGLFFLEKETQEVLL